jgi:hypothetical protein
VGLDQGAWYGEALGGQPGGIDQVTVNPLGRLVDELKDGALVVEDECLDVDAEVLSVGAHPVVHAVNRGLVRAIDSF